MEVVECRLQFDSVGIEIFYVSSKEDFAEQLREMADKIMAGDYDLDLVPKFGASE